MNVEPTPTDIAAVAGAMGEPAQPAPQPVAQPEPAAQPVAPAEPVADPFQGLFNTPTEPAAQPAPQPAQPTEPAAPAAPAQPTQPVAAQPQTYEQYIESVYGNLPEAPAAPDPMQVNADDPEAVGRFFTDLMETAKQQFKVEYAREQAVQQTENRLWNDAFAKYGTLRENTQLRDMVHAIRMADFDKGIATTPVQAAERLLSQFQDQYRQGVADNQVVTTYEQAQPTGGNSAPVATTLDRDQALTAVQTGGEEALTSVLDAAIRAGRL